MDRLFDKLSENWGFREEISAFSKYLKDPAWGLFRKMPSDRSEFRKSELGRSLKKALPDSRQFSKCASRIIKAMRAVSKNGKINRFVYGNEEQGICYPLRSDNEIFGFIVLCGFKRKMTIDLERIFAAFTESVIRESRKEIELEEINKTVRPRAIALSTVHTVHRLMTSTLDLGELLPRIARLSLQVIRANRCSIKLVDKKRKALLPMTTVDLRKKKVKLKKVAIGKYAPGRAFKKGMPIRADKYLATPMVDEDVVGVITLYDKMDGKPFSPFDQEIMKTMAEQAAIAIKNAQLFREQEDLTMNSIKCIAQLMETRPHGTHRPEASFIKLLNIIGRKFDMNETEIKMLQYAAMLHDAGQISIPEKLLAKRGELTGRELDIIKKHPLKGANILARFKPLKPIVPIILYHHENWNGTGYPKGLKGEAIPLSARILGVASSFEAMITEKPYRKALSINAAIKEVEKNSGVQFDPVVVKAFIDAIKRKDVRKLLNKELGKE